ncbi:MAG TPA: transposase, partial [Candidatus Acidoferrales bacterium]|nr:transposase [Candidatus Acidoferrales bacterium]
PLLTRDREPLLRQILGGKASEIGAFIHAVGNTTDHVHLVVGIPPKVAVSECVRQLKGSSSHALNDPIAPFRWQEGYGALTVSDEILATVVAYVHDQKQHHAEGSLNAHFERLQQEDPLADF